MTVHLISINTTWICRICMHGTKVSVLEVWHLVWINFSLFSMRCMCPRAEIKSCMQVGFAVIQKEEEFQHGESEHRESGLSSGVLLPNLTPADTTFSFRIFRLYIYVYVKVLWSFSVYLVVRYTSCISVDSLQSLIMRLCAQGHHIPVAWNSRWQWSE